MSSDETIEIAKAELMKVYDAAVDECEKPQTKFCKHCDTTKPVEEFGPYAAAKDGLQCYCRKCRVEITRESRRRNKKIRKRITAKIAVAAEALGRKKVCRTCKEKKLFTEFRDREFNADGKCPHCHECENYLLRFKYYMTQQREKFAREIHAMGTL